MPDSSALPDDDILIKQLLSRDEAAYSRLILAYHRIMIDIARAIVSTSIAEEVVQDAWLAVIKALPRFEQRSSLKTWIFRIVSNTAKSRLRKESRSVPVGDLLKSDAVDLSDRFSADGHWSTPPRHWNIETPEDLLASSQLRQIIDDTITGLPPMQKAVFLLHDRQGVNMSDICKILDISESNSRVLLHRARTLLHNAIEQDQEI